jgi:hypothetical protein
MSIPAHERRLKRWVDLQARACSEKQIAASASRVDEASTILRHEVHESFCEQLASKERSDLAEILNLDHISQPSASLSIEVRTQLGSVDERS